jgi:predicted esterase
LGVTVLESGVALLKTGVTVRQTPWRASCYLVAMKTGRILGLSLFMGAVGTQACSSGGNGSSTNDASSDVTVDASVGSDAMNSNDAIVDVVGDGPTKQPCTANQDQVGLTMRTAMGNPYVAYVPASYDPTKLTPLVIVLHGDGDTAENYLNVIWKANADTDGFIVIAPEGTAAVGNGGYTYNISDKTLILAAAVDVYNCYAIDWRREIMHGFSAGGIMAYIIGLSQAQLFSGVSISSSDLGTAEYYNGGSLLPSAWEIPFSLSHGTQDQNFPIAMTGIPSMEALEDAGHTVYWHEFNGGHTTTPALAQLMYLDLESSLAP